jgi:hypothetical protein
MTVDSAARFRPVIDRHYNSFFAPLKNERAQLLRTDILKTDER